MDRVRRALHVCLRWRWRQDPNRPVPRRRPHCTEQPVLREERPGARHTGAARIRARGRRKSTRSRIAGTAEVPHPAGPARPPDPARSTHPANGFVIAATRLTRRFGSRTVVNDITFAVSRSEIVALLGPNGAGKTTTLRMLAGLIAPTSGSVAIDGVQLTKAAGTSLRRRIGFLTEAPGLWDRLTVRENLRIYAGLYDLAHAEQTIDRALEMFELTDCRSARAAELSKGMRQKVALARALLHDPAILLLDEPSSGLDPEVMRMVRRLLEERRAAGCSILVSTH
ncbi:MAG: heme ABC exporter ATP-binding protein CcmA [Acidobacteria bacterium]|nr:MAG: heme ABC exporter ATP-binding protein CcmA [Acidobacteriota bacterium]